MTLRKSYQPKEQEDEFSALYNFLGQWKPTKDVFALKYFSPTLSTVAAITASYVNIYFRKAVHLKNKGYVSSFLPIVILPSMLGTILHFMMVTRPILLREYDCPVCIEVKSGTLSVISGLIFPSLLAPVNAFMSANRYYTYAIPSIVNEKKKCLILARSFFKPILPRLYILGGIQFFVGMMLAHFEMKNFETVMEKIAMMEAYIEEKKAERSRRASEGR